MPLNYPAVGGATAAEIASLSAEQVWTYVTRILTSLANPTDIIKFLGKGSGTEVPSNKSLYDLIALDRWDVRLPAARAALIDQITAARMAELDPANVPGDIDTLLSRLTAARAGYLDYLSTVLNAKLPVMELEQAYVADDVQTTLNTTGSDQSLGSRNITVALPSGASRVRAIALALIHVANRTANAQDIDFNLKVAGATIFTQDNVCTFDTVIGSAVVTLCQECTTQVTGDGTFSIEAEAQISAAQNVTFTVEYLIFVQYKMS